MQICIQQLLLVQRPNTQQRHPTGMKPEILQFIYHKSEIIIYHAGYTGLQWVGKVATIFLDCNLILEGATTLHKGERTQTGKQMLVGGRNLRQTKSIPPQLLDSTPR